MKYAVDTTVKFNGSNYHCMTDDNVNMFTKISFEDMKKESPGLVLLNDDDFNEQYYMPHIESYRTDWNEVTKEQWWDLYECLPPYKAGRVGDVFLFCCPEATTGWMHTWGAEVNGKYYFATRGKFSNLNELIKDLP